jgi:sulfatase modifying factor 1
VTQAAWANVKGGSPSRFKGDQLPVESVDWAQAGEYCKAIGGRLPTEKEWEYAARAGTTGARYSSLDAVAWYTSNSGGTTHPVGLKLANAFGLYDMLGNVWEWTANNSDSDAGYRVIRGGAWNYRATELRVTYRGGARASSRDDTSIGFRCVAEFR